MAVLNQHPEDWLHIVAKPQPPQAHIQERSAVTVSAAAEPSAESSGTATITFAAEELPWVEPPVYRPPAAGRRARRVPPLLVGAVAGLVVVLIVVLIAAS